MRLWVVGANDFVFGPGGEGICFVVAELDALGGYVVVPEAFLGGADLECAV